VLSRNLKRTVKTVNGCVCLRTRWELVNQAVLEKVTR